MKTTQQTKRINTLVEEFDRATGFRFDRITEPAYLSRLADMIPCRDELGDDLRDAFRAVREEGKP